MTGAGPQVIQHRDAEDLSERVAARLLRKLVDLQADGRVAQLCLTGGRIALSLYARLGELVADSALDPSRLELWWGDERFVPTDDPERNAGPTLALLARHFALDPARTHPMPSADGVVDAAASAATYAKELRRDQVRPLSARDGAGRPRRLDLPWPPVQRTDHPAGDRGE